MPWYIRRILAYAGSMAPGALAALALFLCLGPWRRRRLARLGLRSGALREAALALLWMFSGGMAVLTLLPAGWRDFPVSLRYGVPLGPFFAPGTVNLTLFGTVRGHLDFIDWGNILMFVPFGFLPALVWRGFTGRRALTLALAVTGSIECWQLLIGRAFDVDDLLLNTLGALLGWLLWRALDRLAPAVTGKFHCRPAELE